MIADVQSNGTKWEYGKNYHSVSTIQNSVIADHILADGWMRPPCKVGDTVYVINDCKVEETAVFSMTIQSEDEHWTTFVKAKVVDHGLKIRNVYARMFKTFVFGKTIFLTREEAEQALKERKEK